MDKTKQAKLSSKGWKVGTVNDFLELTPEEATYIELRLTLSENLKKRRTQKQLTQNQFAQLLKYSPSHVEKLETGDSSVSLDILIQSLLALGASIKELADIIAHSPDFSGHPSLAN